MDWKIEALKFGGTLVAGAAGGGGLWTYLSNRVTTKSTRLSSPAQITESQADLVKAVNEQTKTILDEASRLRRESTRERRDLKLNAARQDKRITALTAAVKEQTAKHENCEYNLAEVRAMVELMRTTSPAGALVINPHPLKDQIDG